MNLREYQELLVERASKNADSLAEAIAERKSLPRSLVRAVLEERAPYLAMTEAVEPEAIEHLGDWAMRRLAKKNIYAALKDITNPQDYPPIKPPKWYHPYRRHQYNRYNRRRKRIMRTLNKFSVNEASPYPKYIPFSKDEPVTQDIDSPNYLPRFTTNDTFNQHVSEVVEPYIVSLVKKVAKERKLAVPDDESIKKAVNSVDWAEAAYFAREAPASPTRVRLFAKKFITDPINKAVHAFPGEQLLFATQTLLVATFMYKGLKTALGATNTVIPKTIDGIMAVVNKLRWLRIGMP